MMQSRNRFIGTALSVLLAVSIAPQLLAASAMAQTPSAGSPNGSFSSNKTSTGPIAPDKSHPLDLNASSEADLSSLPGVGTTRAQAIVSNRPYKKKEELLQRGLVPKEVYTQISSLVVVK